MNKKRFYVAKSNLIDGYCVFDREKKYAFSPKPREADCLNDAHVLNELHKENQSLKKKLEFFYELNKPYRTIIEENQALQRHIKRSTFNKIRVEDVFNCAKYDKFYDNEEAIKSIDWIAKELGVDFE